jgi:hypothetical protein
MDKHFLQMLATASSNKVATTLGMQDFSQLKKDNGKEQADVIMKITGNIISGQVMGETAKHLSERFGKIMQDRVDAPARQTTSGRGKLTPFLLAKICSTLKF